MGASNKEISQKSNEGEINTFSSIQKSDNGITIDATENNDEFYKMVEGLFLRDRDRKITNTLRDDHLHLSTDLNKTKTLQNCKSHEIISVNSTTDVEGVNASFRTEVSIDTKTSLAADVTSEEDTTRQRVKSPKKITEKAVKTNRKNLDKTHTVEAALMPTLSSDQKPSNQYSPTAAMIRRLQPAPLTVRVNTGTTTTKESLVRQFMSSSGNSADNLANSDRSGKGEAKGRFPRPERSDAGGIPQTKRTTLSSSSISADNLANSDQVGKREASGGVPRSERSDAGAMPQPKRGTLSSSGNSADNLANNDHVGKREAKDRVLRPERSGADNPMPHPKDTILNSSGNSVDNLVNSNQVSAREAQGEVSRSERPDAVAMPHPNRTALH